MMSTVVSNVGRAPLPSGTSLLAMTAVSTDLPRCVLPVCQRAVGALPHPLQPCNAATDFGAAQQMPLYL